MYKTKYYIYIKGGIMMRLNKTVLKGFAILTLLCMIGSVFAEGTYYSYTWKDFAIDIIVGEELYHFATGQKYDGEGLAFDVVTLIPFVKVLKAAKGIKALALAGKVSRATKTFHNTKEFLKSTNIGKKIFASAEPASRSYKCAKIYRITGKPGVSYLKKGDYIYLDTFHKNHLEVFDKRGNFKGELYPDGTFRSAEELGKTNRRLKI
jgi:hypothetical protein